MAETATEWRDFAVKLLLAMRPTSGTRIQRVVHRNQLIQH
jgi:hypothetical protein